MKKPSSHRPTFTPTKEKKNSAVSRRNVFKANKLKNPLERSSSFSKYENNGKSFYFECNRVNSLDSSTLNWILDLEQRNMKKLYEKCDWGWDFEKKKAEMTDTMAWYLIAKSSKDNKCVGFSHFRFDVDYGYAVLYCYEIQLEVSIRRIGLGKCFMNLLELIAFNNRMEKVVLTVFKHNDEARNFFTSLNYSVDASSPEDDEDNKYCYIILSKESNTFNK